MVKGLVFGEAAILVNYTLLGGDSRLCVIEETRERKQRTSWQPRGDKSCFEGSNPPGRLVSDIEELYLKVSPSALCVGTCMYTID